MQHFCHICSVYFLRHLDNQGVRMLPSTIRFKLYITASILTFVAIFVGLLGLYNLKNENENFKSVYEDRIVPLKQLKIISDLYAINIVDTVHKTNAQALSYDDAFKSIKNARTTIAKTWSSYIATKLTTEEEKLAETAQKLFIPAERMVDELLSVIEKKDKEKTEKVIREKIKKEKKK